MIIDVSDFSLDLTLNSGQTFIWKKIDDTYYSFVDYPISVKELNGKLYIEGNVTESYIRNKLGLYDDITDIERSIDKDDFIHDAINYSHGIRVINDGLWVSTLSFILSIQSNINLIQRYWIVYFYTVYMIYLFFQWTFG